MIIRSRPALTSRRSGCDSKACMYPANLKRFLVEIAIDPERFPAFLADPGQAAKQAGVPHGSAPLNDERLVAVGTGIRAAGQMTIEAIAWIKRADKVLWCVIDSVAQEIIKTQNPEGEESLLSY